MYITCFNSRGRYHLYKCIFEEVEHPGIQGLIVHEIKEEINATLSVCMCVLLCVSIDFIYIGYREGLSIYWRGCSSTL